MSVDNASGGEPPGGGSFFRFVASHAKDQGKSLEDLASAIGYPPDIFQRILDGKADVNDNFVIKLGRALNITVGRMRSEYIRGRMAQVPFEWPDLERGLKEFLANDIKTTPEQYCALGRHLQTLAIGSLAMLAALAKARDVQLGVMFWAGESSLCIAAIGALFVALPIRHAFDDRVCAYAAYRQQGRKWKTAIVSSVLVLVGLLLGIGALATGTK